MSLTVGDVKRQLKDSARLVQGLHQCALKHGCMSKHYAVAENMRDLVKQLLSSGSQKSQEERMKDMLSLLRKFYEEVKDANTSIKEMRCTLDNCGEQWLALQRFKLDSAKQELRMMIRLLEKNQAAKGANGAKSAKSVTSAKRAIKMEIAKRAKSAKSAMSAKSAVSGAKSGANGASGAESKKKRV